MVADMSPMLGEGSRDAPGRMPERGARRRADGDQGLTSGDFGVICDGSGETPRYGQGQRINEERQPDHWSMASCTCPPPLRERFHMRFPQVSERVKEAPAHALRAVFASIGQVRLVTDRMKNKPGAEERATSTRSGEPATAATPVTEETAAGRHGRHPGSGGHGRCRIRPRSGSSPPAAEPGPADGGRSGHGGPGRRGPGRRSVPAAEESPAAGTAAGTEAPETEAAETAAKAPARKGQVRTSRGATPGQARHDAGHANGECPAAARLGRHARGRAGRTGGPGRPGGRRLPRRLPRRP